jgi:cysteine sulfinate desulfinase/cysteine desulfurase-like protein
MRNRRGTVSEQEDDLRATTEDIAADAEEMQAIEREKARLEPEDPRMTELSEEVERIARGIVPKTVAERQLVEEANGGPKADDGNGSSNGRPAAQGPTH